MSLYNNPMICDVSLIRSGLKRWPKFGQFDVRSGEAAVLVLICRFASSAPHLLLTRRAVHMRHHGGEVAFPGGMWERGDHFPVATALREANEEVDLFPEAVEVLGTLPVTPTRNLTQVTPVVGLIDSLPQLQANPQEIESIFYVPLSDLHPDKRVRTDIFTTRKPLVWAPAYEYEGFEIWGFTAVVIRLLLERCFNQHVERDHPAPEKYW